MARGSGLPAFNRYMHNLLGRKPTEAEIAAAITLTESNPISGKQDSFDILGAIHNRASVDGRIDTKAYDGVAYKKRHGVGAGNLSNITKERMAPYVAKYNEWKAGKSKPSHSYTHYFHPTAMKAIGERKPSMVRSSPWKTIVFGDHKITAPTPTWLNPEQATWAGGHTGLFTTPSHIADTGKYQEFLSRFRGLAPAPSGSKLTTEQMLQQIVDRTPDGAPPLLASNEPQTVGSKGTTVPKEELARVLADKEASIGAPNASTLPEGGYGSFGGPKQRGFEGEDLSAPAPTPTMTGQSGAAPSLSLRPDQTSDWVQWQHGQMQGALNTGPKHYVPPANQQQAQPKPVSSFNMNLADLLGRNPLQGWGIF